MYQNAETFPGAYPADASLPLRLYDDMRTMGIELTQPNGTPNMRKLGATVLAGAAQGVDRLRGLAWIMPPAFDEVLTYSAEHGFNGYEQAGASAAVMGGIFGAWSWVVGRSLQTAINELPETTQKVTENHPAMVAAITRAVGGFPKQDDLEQQSSQQLDTGYEVGPYDAKRSLLGKVALGVKRGFNSALVYGSTAYVGVSKSLGYSDESTSRFRRAASTEGSLAFAGLATGVSALITHDSFGLAEDIKDTLAYRPIWFGVAATAVGASALLNWRARRSATGDMLANQ
jgi:hypothetical protein